MCVRARVRILMEVGGETAVRLGSVDGQHRLPAVHRRLAE